MNHQKMETQLIKQQFNSGQLGIFGILRESFKTTNRNRKLLFQVLVLVFLFFSLLNFAELYLVEPVAKDFSLQLTNHPNMFQDIGTNMHLPAYSDAINDIRKYSLVKLSILTIRWITNLVFLIAIVSSTYEAYTAKLLNPTETILSIRKSWKKVTDTSLWLILINLGLVTLCFFSIGLVSFLAGGSSAVYIFYGVVCFSVPILCFYISALWMMSLVVSVLEDVSGLDAIVRGRKLIKGERVQASLVMVLVAVAYGLVRLMKDAIESNNLDKVAVTIPFGNWMSCVVKVFVFVVFTVYYHERKESCEGKLSLYVPPMVGAGEV